MDGSQLVSLKQRISKVSYVDMLSRKTGKFLRSDRMFRDNINVWFLLAVTFFSLVYLQLLRLEDTSSMSLIYGHGRSPEPDGRKGLEIPPKVPPMGGVFWSTHISIIIFPTKL